MTVKAIKEAIEHLPVEDQAELWQWLDDRQQATWDAEIERDFSPGGRGRFLLEEAKSDLAAGRTKPLDQFLAEAKHMRRTGSKVRR
ncbi:conserved hypothetical protein [Candidatus Sulfopaludibacter sp. SbA6]|nr:conserved hypothetical protein [Candidatus Sulfopaludibacter sp. SbA6]